VDVVSCRTQKSQDLHRHEYLEVLFVEKGSQTSRFKGFETQMKKGDVLIIKPYALHMLEDSPGQESGKAYYCSFLPQIVDYQIQALEELIHSDSPNRYFFKPFEPLLKEEVDGILFKTDSKHFLELTGLFQQLKETSQGYGQRSQARTRCLFLTLLAVLADQYELDKKAHELVRTVSSVPVSRCMSGFQKALTYIHDHCEQPLSLDEVAVMCGTDKPYFCRLFKHETGTTFLNYLNGLRIERACLLLRGSPNNVMDICYRVGFNQYPCFNRQFKRHVGMSPTEFRKTNLRDHGYREPTALCA
jgi:AraC-like DNA-binding protein